VGIEVETRDLLLAVQHGTISRAGLVSWLEDLENRAPADFAASLPRPRPGHGTVRSPGSLTNWKRSSEIHGSRRGIDVRATRGAQAGRRTRQARRVEAAQSRGASGDRIREGRGEGSAETRGLGIIQQEPQRLTPLVFLYL
jgi:hypothetical protein